MFCITCDREIKPEITGEPFLEFNLKPVCFDCYISLIPEIYSMSGYGDGGLIHYGFLDCLSSNINRKKRRSLKNTILFKKVLHKYKFKCVFCGEAQENKLTLDHIKPVKLGGLDKLTNLQILCRSCNSRKGVTYERTLA